MPGKGLALTGMRMVWVLEWAWWEKLGNSWWALASAGEYMSQGWVMVNVQEAAPLVSKCLGWLGWEKDQKWAVQAIANNITG